MTKFPRLFLLTLFFLINTASAQGQGEGVLAQYKLSKLSRVVQAHTEADPELEQSGIKLGSDPVKVTVTYTGLSRPALLSKRRFITSYVFQDGTPVNRSGFATEMLFREGQAGFWLMVRDELVPRLMRELRRGDNVDLYAIWVGATYPTRGKRQQVFLVNEFRKPVPRRRARVTSGTPDRWYAFTGLDGDFTIQLPSEPEREQVALGPVAAIRRYSSTTDTHYLGIDYEDIGPAASILTPTYEETVSSLLRERGFKIASVRRLSKNSSQMELWSPSRTPGGFLHSIERTTMRHGRRYTVFCGSRIKGQEVDKAVCRRLFDSFHIVRAPQ
jgi:hypothetical protein